MPSANYKSKILENTLAIGVLLILHENKQPMISGVLASNLARSAGTTIDRITELEQAGLLKREQEDKRPFRKFVSLTPYGQEVAKHLKAIEDIMQEMV